MFTIKSLKCMSFILSFTDFENEVSWTFSPFLILLIVSIDFSCHSFEAQMMRLRLTFAATDRINNTVFYFFISEGQQGWVWDKFNESVPMSTYLVAFVVSDFGSINSTANKNSLFRSNEISSFFSQLSKRRFMIINY